MKKFVSRVLVFAMSASLLSGIPRPALAEAAAPATISGTLCDADGKALAGKKVTLRERSAKDGGGRFTATTDADGRYTASVPAGVYQVIGLPYDFDAKENKPENVSAVAQAVVLGEGQEAKQDLQVPAPVTIPNGEFDNEDFSDADWQAAAESTGVAQKVEAKNNHSGANRFRIWLDKDYQFDVFQTLADLKAGTHMISFAVNAGDFGENDEFYAYAKDGQGNILTQENIRATAEGVWEVAGMVVEVGDSPVTVGFSGKLTAGAWANIDEFRMGRIEEPEAYTKAQLKELLDEAGGLQAADYMAASYAELTEAKTQAQAVYDNVGAADNEITQAFKALRKAIDGLIPAKSEADADIQNDIFWRDTDGNFIYSQGGGIFRFGDTYYWYGVKYEEAEKYAQDPTTGPYKTDPSPKFLGVTCYSSKNLVDWKNEGLVVERAEVTGRPEMNNQEVAWVGRLGVAKVGEKYALLVQHECPDEDNSLDGNMDTDKFSKQVLVLSSDAPDGKFTWNQRINMKDYTGGTSNTGDQTVFTDDDGTSYLVYSYGSGRGRIFLSQIVAQENGKIGLASSHKIYQGAGREGNCMFKYNNKYYVCASDLYGWNASHAYYMVLDSLADSYLDSFTPTTSMALMDGSSDDFCHVTQTGFFCTVKGSQQETVIFCGDRWSDFAKNGLGYNQWCPLSFKADGTPCFNSLSAWDLDSATGKWTVHGNNNYVKNGSFDADRVAAAQLAGWTNTVGKGNSPINNNEDEATGKYALKLGDTAEFDCKVSQVIAQDAATADAVALPDGTYSLTAKVKNSGPFEELSMYAKSGSLTKKAFITQAHAAYTEVMLRDVAVSGGKAEIGFIAKGNAKASALVDDVALVRSLEQSVDTESITVPVSSDTAKNVAITLAAEDGTAAYIYEGKLESGKHSYTIAPVKAGVYTVTVAVNACEIQGAAQKVTVTAGQEAQTPEVTVINQGGDIAGKVVDGNGAGIAGVAVILTKGEQTIQVKTEDDGTFGVSDILAGTYAIRLEKEGYVSPEQKTVEVEVGKTATVADQAMQSAMGTVTGTVRNADGAPAGNATVTLRGCKTKSSARRYTAQADAEGKYSIPVIEDTYQVLASKEGVNVQGISLEKVAVERNKSYTADVAIPEAVPVPNGDFERDLNPAADWSNKGTRGKWTNRAADVLSGKGGYNIWDGSIDFTVDLCQTLKNLENGTYVVNVKADSEFKAEDELYVYAKDAAGILLAREDIPNISIDKQGEVIGIVAEVKDGTLTIGLSGSMSGGAWSHVDDFCVGRIETTYSGGEDEKIDVSKAEIAAIPAQVYTGKPLTPAVEVTYGDKVLVKGQDYRLAYKNNKNIGTAAVTVAGMGRYENSLSGKFTITVKKNKTYTVGNYKYKITNPKVNGTGTVAMAGGKSKGLKSVKASDMVTIGGRKFKITSVGKNAFKGYKKLGSVTLGKNVAKIEAGAFEKCGKLKKIKIGSPALKSVGKNAIKGIDKQAVIQCPGKQLAKYKKFFKASTGFKKTMKVKK